MIITLFADYRDNMLEINCFPRCIVTICDGSSCQEYRGINYWQIFRIPNDGSQNLVRRLKAPQNNHFLQHFTICKILLSFFHADETLLHDAN